MIKDIVVNLSIGGSRDVVAEYAIALAGALGAHLSGVVFAYEPVIAPSILGGVSASLIDEQRAEGIRNAEQAIARFNEAARRAGLSAETRKLAAGLAAAADLFGRIARRFDIAVVGQAEPGKLAPEELIVEGALFESGRPVILVPYIHKTGVKLDRILVCWDGSRTAARAIGDAMPLLEHAKSVEIVMVATGKPKSDEIPGADIALHLARHALKVEIKRIAAGNSEVASTILSHAADVSADFIVMGAYGHSRLREFILGGATRGILATMTVPVLMSH